MSTSGRIIVLILSFNLLLSGFVGAEPLWLCRDADGSVSLEDTHGRETCCAKGHARDHEPVGAGYEAGGDPCCHDSLVDAGQGSDEMQVPAVPVAPKLCVWPPLLVFASIKPAPTPPVSDAPLDPGGPPLAHLATVILVI